MKRVVVWTLALSCGLAAASAASEYALIIDGVTNTVELGKNQTLQLPGGEARVRLERQAATHFVRPMFGFHLAVPLGVNSTAIGEGVHQSLITTPRGALILIQEYETTDPRAMVEMMLEEITKNEQAADYEVSKEQVTQTVGDLEIRGERARSTTGHEEWVREVYSASAGESGVLSITAIEVKNNAREQELIDEFWEHLSLTLTPPPASEDP